MAEVAAVVGITTSLIGAYSQYKSGALQEKMYDMKARQARLTARQQSLNEQRKGVAELEKLRAYMAVINARSAAGSIDAFSGTPAVFKSVAETKGFENFGMTQDNAALIETQGILQAADLEIAGDMAKYQARMGALMKVGQAGLTYAMTFGGGGGSVGQPIGGARVDDGGGMGPALSGPARLR